MGSIRHFKVGKTKKEFETHLVWVPKRRALNSKRFLKKQFGNQVRVRITKSPRHSGYDVYTNPDEREFGKLRKRRKM